MEKRGLLYSGKVKSMFETDDPRFLLAEFRDDTTAFDGKKHARLANKGLINNLISAHLMGLLEQAGVPTHLVKVLSPTEVLVKRLRMIPLESVIRNLAAGSLCRRFGVEANLPLVPPLYETFYKSDALHDPLATRDHALTFGWASKEELELMREYAFKINQVLSEVFARAGMTLVDSKYEFGVDTSGVLCLGDEISPDSCRIWDISTQRPLDKDRFRKDLGGVVEAYEEIAQRLGVALPALHSKT